MQSVSSWIWTRVVVSISYDDNITPQAPPLHLGVVAIETGTFWSPSTIVTNFTLFVDKNSTRVSVYWNACLVTRNRDVQRTNDNTEVCQSLILLTILTKLNITIFHNGSYDIKNKMRDIHWHNGLSAELQPRNKGKSWTRFLSSQLWVGYYHCCSSTKIVLACWYAIKQRNETNKT